jgi:hypothetical protein
MPKEAASIKPTRMVANIEGLSLDGFIGFAERWNFGEGLNRRIP